MELVSHRRNALQNHMYLKKPETYDDLRFFFCFLEEQTPHLLSTSYFAGDVMLSWPCDKHTQLLGDLFEKIKNF